MERAVLLISSLTTDQIQEVNQRRMEGILTSKQIAFDKVDGVLPENKPIRDELFQCSGARGKYPQCFIRKPDGSLEFVGLWEEFENLTDCETLPSDVLAANPSIRTFSTVFQNCQRT